MKFRHFTIVTASLFFNTICGAQDSPKPENATAAVLRAFDTHDIVMFGEIHGNKQEYEWLRSLVATPEFADRVDDIVVEFGNSLYQKSVDRYVSGEDVPLKMQKELMEQVQKAWRNLAGAVGPPSPVYASFYQAVREANLKRRGKHQMRIVCGDPYIDWDKVKDREDVGPYLANRDQWYAQVVKDEVLARHHRALLIMGWGHFLRGFPPGRRFSIEQQLRSAGARTYLMVAGTNTTGGYDLSDHRFDSWSPAVVVSLPDSWVGDLPALPVISGGNILPGPIAPASASSPSASSPPPLTLKDVADALFYLGPRDSLTQVFTPRAELDGTAYGNEIKRRMTIEFGAANNFIPEKEETPQFSPPQPSTGGGPPRLPPPPKSMHEPLPLWPESQ
jgi:hypothetical protein